MSQEVQTKGYEGYGTACRAAHDGSAAGNARYRIDGINIINMILTTLMATTSTDTNKICNYYYYLVHLLHNKTTEIITKK